MASSLQQIIGLDVNKSLIDIEHNMFSPEYSLVQKPEEQTPQILNYVKRKTINKVHLGNLQKESNYYGFGIDYQLSKALEFYLDITASIDPTKRTYIIAQQATLNFIYKR